VNLSPREREVLEKLSAAKVTNFNALAFVFDGRFPADECRVVVESLKAKGALVVTPGPRCDVVTITDAGEHALSRRADG
jgi:hypothetical protein